MTHRHENRRGYRGLIAWQQAMDFAEQVLIVCDRIPPRRGAGLVPQLRRSAISVPSNIAEGHAGPAGEELTFLRHSRGSLWEGSTQLELVLRRGLLKADTLVALLDSADELGRVIHGSMRHGGRDNAKCALCGRT